MTKKTIIGVVAGVAVVAAGILFIGGGNGTQVTLDYETATVEKATKIGRAHV